MVSNKRYANQDDDENYMYVCHALMYTNSVQHLVLDEISSHAELVLIPRPTMYHN